MRVVDRSCILPHLREPFLDIRDRSDWVDVRHFVIVYARWEGGFDSLIFSCPPKTDATAVISQAYKRLVCYL